MKKIITSLLFISIFSFNLFADDSQVLNLELDLKLGLDFNPTLIVHSDDKTGLAHEFTNSFGLGANFFILKLSDLYLGIGINHIFESEMQTKGYDAKSNITTYYLAGKYKFSLESEMFSNFYLIGNIGYANTNIDNTTIVFSDDPPYSTILRKTKFGNNNFFWEIGFGAEIFDNFLLELTYSDIYGTAKLSTEIMDYMDSVLNENSYKTNYSLIMFKLGYKFEINISKTAIKSPRENTKNEILDKEIEKLKLQKEILQLELEKEKLKQ